MSNIRTCIIWSCMSDIAWLQEFIESITLLNYRCLPNNCQYEQTSSSCFFFSNENGILYTRYILFTNMYVCTLYIMKCSCGNFFFTRLRNGRQLQNKDIHVHYTCSYLTTVFHLTLWCMISICFPQVWRIMCFTLIGSNQIL